MGRSEARDLGEFGFLRVRAVAPPLALADPRANLDHHREALARAEQEAVAVLLFPELSLTGYSCEDLFGSDDLLHGAAAALEALVRDTAPGGPVVVAGAPLAAPDGRLYNVAFVLAGGRIAGAVPKLHLPNHGEFYERRFFASGAGVALELRDDRGGAFRLDARQLFAVGGARFALEICEDLWAPQPPGAERALAGAEVILNPSASNELVGKADYRRDLVRMASAQRICGYLYAGSGPDESSKDVVFGGHLLAAENGVLLAEGERFRLDGSELTREFDVARLRHDRRIHGVWAATARPPGHSTVTLGPAPALRELGRPVPAHPFVPDDEAELGARAHEILSIQATGLARRLRSVPGTGAQRLVLGLSGGLDSTLALVVGLDALDRLAEPAERLLAVTLPGPATSEHTLDSARALARSSGVTLLEVPIGPAVRQHLADLGHPPELHDRTFENTQARERTQLLFDLANQRGAIVLGTGDLSELALGWCTFNADHMASYNVNAGLPKTLVAYVIRWYARHRAGPELAEALQRVLDTPISPELVPGSGADGPAQLTEALVGPYELHDFFLHAFLRFGDGFEKVRLLAGRAFAGRYEPAEIDRWLREFVQRFFTQQFKRTTLPPGPKVGSVALSPRGDWRMPDEVAARAFLRGLGAEEKGGADGAG